MENWRCELQTQTLEYDWHSEFINKLLSIPSSVKKYIAVLFLPCKAIIICLEDRCAVPSYGNQDKDGLLYIEGYHKEVARVDSSTTVPVKAIMAVVKKHSSKSKPVSKQGKEPMQ